MEALGLKNDISDNPAHTTTPPPLQRAEHIRE
jgi:hypothetical protein